MAANNNNEHGITRRFENGMTRWGQGCNNCLEGCSICCGTFNNGWVLCWTNSGIYRRTTCWYGVRPAVNTFYRKLFGSTLRCFRALCFGMSIVLWLTGCLLATGNYNSHCKSHPDIMECGHLARHLLMAGLVVPLVVECIILLAYVYQMWKMLPQQIPKGGPMLLSEKVIWNILIPLFSVFISSSVVFCSPKWVGAAYLFAGIFVFAAALTEIAITLSSRTGLVITFTAISVNLSATVVFDETVEDHHLAVGAIVLACVILILSVCGHMLLARMMNPTPNQEAPEANPNPEDDNELGEHEE